MECISGDEAIEARTPCLHLTYLSINHNIMHNATLADNIFFYFSMLIQRFAVKYSTAFWMVKIMNFINFYRISYLYHPK